jgi:hypothetical protein
MTQENIENQNTKTDEQIWDELFNTPESQELLKVLSEKAQEEMKQGKATEDK